MHLKDAQDVFWTYYICSIYALYPGWVTLDSHLNFEEHLKTVLSKVYKH